MFSPIKLLAEISSPSFPMLAICLLKSCKQLRRSLTSQKQPSYCPVKIEWQDGSPAFVRMSQPLPAFGSHFADAGSIAEMLSVEARAILETSIPMEVVSC